MFTTISAQDTAHASAIYNTQRQSSIALNIAIVTTIVAGVTGSELTKFHAAYLASAIIAGLGAICAWTMIHTSDARSTMHQPR
jgi:hypothetical protein